MRRQSRRWKRTLPRQPLASNEPIHSLEAHSKWNIRRLAAFQGDVAAARDHAVDELHRPQIEAQRPLSRRPRSPGTCRAKLDDLVARSGSALIPGTPNRSGAARLGQLYRLRGRSRAIHVNPQVQTVAHRMLLLLLMRADGNPEQHSTRCAACGKEIDPAAGMYHSANLRLSYHPACYDTLNIAPSLVLLFGLPTDRDEPAADLLPGESDEPDDHAAPRRALGQPAPALRTPRSPSGKASSRET